MSRPGSGYEGVGTTPPHTTSTLTQCPCGGYGGGRRVPFCASRHSHCSPNLPSAEHGGGRANAADCSALTGPREADGLTLGWNLALKDVTLTPTRLSPCLRCPPAALGSSCCTRCLCREGARGSALCGGDSHIATHSARTLRWPQGAGYHFDRCELRKRAGPDGLCEPSRPV